MDSPFFRSHWSQPSRPRHSQNVRGIPVQPAQRPSSSSSTKSKVVSIPVHFVGSETTRSESALKIQKVFRGFLVRKSVKKIASIRREVEEVESRISRSEIVELIRRDAKERLRVNETLMALLLKLDSIRGVDSGIRDCRKAVIKKAIALQERIDDIAAGNQTVSNVVDEDAQFDDQTLEIKDSAEHQTLETEGNHDHVLIDDNQASEIKQFDTPDAKEADFLEEAVDESREVHCDDAPAHDSCQVEAIAETKDDGFAESAPEICEKMDIAEITMDSEVNADEDGCVVNADEDGCVVKQIVEDQSPTLPVSGCVEESVVTSPTPSSLNPTEAADENTSERQEDGKNSKDCVGAGGKDYDKQLLERVMEDNEKMMSLMAQLIERNEMQTQMLNSLTQRVEHLERAFICDKLRRKKKRHATGTVDGVDSTPDQKKCGKQ